MVEIETFSNRPHDLSTAANFESYSVPERTRRGSSRTGPAPFRESYRTSRVNRRLSRRRAGGHRKWQRPITQIAWGEGAIVVRSVNGSLKGLSSGFRTRLKSVRYVCRCFAIAFELYANTPFNKNRYVRADSRRPPATVPNIKRLLRFRRSVHR